MEQYASQLEHTVKERTRELVQEAKKTDTLLYSLVPAWVSL